MKKLLIITLALILFCVCAIAEDIDLSGLSYEQLLVLQERVSRAILECEEWQEVKVPVGIWKTGEDIPAGKWTVRCATDKYSFITIGTQLTDGGLSISMLGDHYGSGLVYSPNYKNFKPDEDRTELTFTLYDGDYIHIDDSAVIFTPYAGKPDLGFK